jgi:AraC-like DNA-binding protein
MHPPWIGISDNAFRRISTVYRQRYPVECWACRPDGRMVFQAGTGITGMTGLNRARATALAEGMRWGDPSFREYDDQLLLWAVPLMVNAQVVGGLVAAVLSEQVLTDDGDILIDLQRAGIEWRELAEGENVTNAALLRELRQQHRREQRRAEAIHEVKARYAGDVLESYLREEPGLMTAIRQGRRTEAVAILNRLLMLLYGYAGEQLEVIKSLMLELVVSMCRSAVLAGGDPRQLMGTRYADLTELGGIDDEERLSAWLVDMLERIMNSVGRGSGDSSLQKLQRALTLMSERLDQDLKRGDIAYAVDWSSAHFTRVLKEKTGLSFTAQLTQLRINRAIELLANSNQGLLDIALATGFSDQSYFTRVFRKHTGLTPAAYRREHSRDS